MLSKVLDAFDAGRAEPVRFTPVDMRRSPARLPLETRSEGVPAEALRAALDRIRQLEEELASVHRDASASGREQGERESRLELVPVLARLASSTAELIAMRAGIRERSEKDLVQLSLLIARRVLHREMSVDPSALTALARVVFERMARAESYQVVIHPQFADAIRSALPANQLSRVEIQADPSVPPGTLTLRSAEGLIDASVDVQLEEINRGLTDKFSKT
ncbi:MAG: FliH/SctL family protein [Terriglobia bacterium]